VEAVTRRRRFTGSIEQMSAEAQARGDRWTPPRRVFTSWSRALTNARSYAFSTGWKYRVHKVRGGFFMVSKLDRRVDWGPDWAKPLGTVRMTIETGP
jgi:hypothetical protein